MSSIHSQINYKTLTLKEKAVLYDRLMKEPGWQLLKQTFRPEIRSRVTDVDAKEAFLYEAIRAQVIHEIFSTPSQIINQVDQQYFLHHVLPENNLAEVDGEDAAL